MESPQRRTIVLAAVTIVLMAGCSVARIERATDDDVDLATSTTTVGLAAQSVSELIAPPDWLRALEGDSSVTTTVPGEPPVNKADFDAVVLPGQSIQTAVDSLPQGSRILIGSGLHTGQLVKPKLGMIFVGEPGAILDGLNRTEYAFVAFEDSDADYVEIRGLEIRGYAPPFDAHGAVMGSHRVGWKIIGNEIHGNLYSGANAGPESVVRGNLIHDNGRIGLKANGADITISNNEISYNNLKGEADPLWEAGGIKVIRAKSAIIRGNFIHDNNGPGIWIDIDGDKILIEENVVERNTYAGIDYEISFRGVIRRNIVRFNGLEHPGGWMWGAGITVRGSEVQVYENTVVENANGIALIQTDRGNEYELHDVVVVGNTVIGSGRSGAVSSDGSNDIFETSLFGANTYMYHDIEGRWWEWQGQTLTSEEWLQVGNDLGGTFRSR